MNFSDSFYLSQNLTSIGNDSFVGHGDTCSPPITTLVIPDSVTTIWTGSFNEL